MNGFTIFVVGVVALLATPEPTNTLLATSGAIRGVRSPLALHIVEIRDAICEHRTQ